MFANSQRDKGLAVSDGVEGCPLKGYSTLHFGLVYSKRKRAKKNLVAGRKDFLFEEASFNDGVSSTYPCDIGKA